MTIGLVGCSSRKQKHTSFARDLYLGMMFAAAVAHFKARGLTWRVISAKHGILSPTQPVAPYDHTFKHKTPAEFRTWAEQTEQVLEPLNATFFVIAGSDYKLAIPGVYIVPFGIEAISDGFGAIMKRITTSTVNKVLIIGVAPSRTREGRPALIGSSSGARLERLIGLQPGELGRVADTANLVSTFPGSKTLGDVEPPPASLTAAAAKLDISPYDSVILCGDAVRRAFDCDHDYLESFTLRGKRAMAIPHPSGINRWWNDRANVDSAVDAIRKFVPETRLIF